MSEKNQLLELNKQVQLMEEIESRWDRISNESGGYSTNKVIMPLWLADELRPAFEELLEKKREELESFQVTRIDQPAA